jgi:hypothetical protein
MAVYQKQLVATMKGSIEKQQRRCSSPTAIAQFLQRSREAKPSPRKKSEEPRASLKSFEKTNKLHSYASRSAHYSRVSRIFSFTFFLFLFHFS